MRENTPKICLLTNPCHLPNHQTQIAHLDAPIVDVADARRPVREQRGHRESHGGVGDVIAVMVDATQLSGRRPWWDTENVRVDSGVHDGFDR